MVPGRGDDVKRAITTFFKDPEPVSSIDDVEPGLNVVDGIAKVDEPLRSPVRGHNCIAYFYRSFLVMTGGRAGAPAIHKLKQAEVYAPFDLEMEGGVLPVVPSKPGSFSREDHQDLAGQYGKGFQGVEEVIQPGARVRVRGKAKAAGGRLVLKMSDISVLEKRAVAAGVVGDRKERRKKRKRRK